MKSTLLLAQKRRGIVWPVYWRLLFHQWECGRFCMILCGGLEFITFPTAAGSSSCIKYSRIAISQD